MLITEKIPESSMLSEAVSKRNSVIVEESLSNKSDEAHLKGKNTNPTIILCCPNAGYYEYLCYEVNKPF